MEYAKPPALRADDKPTRAYRAITRHTDGRIIHVRDFTAGSDAEAILIVTSRGSDIRTDLWSDEGLVRQFGMQARYRRFHH
ncbi:hypothetical protein [Methylobacterium sp. Leaf88]|uniref:hypothetical protein n=1 Tax=Methylobacterium sp. Leaf88 TaxID=1736244 RepID=UPI000AC87CDB|nr:hypothetical protein [Methylobacterium sp. Leaf88]